MDLCLISLVILLIVLSSKFLSLLFFRIESLSRLLLANVVGSSCKYVATVVPLIGIIISSFFNTVNDEGDDFVLPDSSVASRSKFLI